MYVDELKTFVDIAKVIPVNEKTIRKWAKEFGWLKLRKEALTKQQTSIEQAEDIAKKLGDVIQKQLDDGEPVEATMIQAYRGLVRDLKQVKTYSDEKQREEKQADKKPELKAITLDAINKAFK